MADFPRPAPPWRAHVFHLTRNRRFLAKGVAVILGASAVIAFAVHSWQDRDAGQRGDAFPAHSAQLRDALRRLELAPGPAPTLLAAWIRNAARHWNGDEAPEARPAFLSGALQLGSVKLEPVLRKHAEGEAAFQLFASYVRCRFGMPGPELTAAKSRLEQAANATPPLRFAREFHADVLLLLDASVEEALRFYVAESEVPDAVHARKMAFFLALQTSNKEVLRDLGSRPGIFQEIDPTSIMHAAGMTGDMRLLWLALLSIEAQRWSQPPAVCLTLFAAGIWYVILISTGSREPWRWLRYLPPILAGVASVWLIHWMQAMVQYQAMPENAPSPAHELLHWIIYVGLPEESCKLAMFALFLPWLLRQRSARKASLVAGCVGLGFALDENLQYISSMGPEVVTSRLLTANFLHICLTGIVGWHLYELFRSRFHHAATFLMAFTGACVAHGLYNFSGNAAMSDWGMEIVGMIILALGARLYLPEIRHQAAGSDPISRTSIFWFGSAFLTGTLMLHTVAQSGSLSGITETLKGAIVLVPVGLIYLKEFDEVR